MWSEGTEKRNRCILPMMLQLLVGIAILLSQGGSQDTKSVDDVQNRIDEANKSDNSNRPGPDSVYKGKVQKDPATGKPADTVDGIAHLNLHITYHLASKNGSEEIYRDSCINACQGTSNSTHEECKTGCDVACTKDHKKELRAASHYAEIGGVKGRFRLAKSIVDAGASQSGLAPPGYYRLTPDDVLKSLGDLAKQTFTTDAGHPANSKPCTTTNILYHEDQYELQALITVTMTVRTAAGSEEETVKQGTVPLASIWIANQKPRLTDTAVCGCKKEPPKTTTGMLGLQQQDGLFVSLPTTTSTMGYNELVGRDKGATYQLAATCKDMNSCDFVMTGGMEIMTIPCGTRLVPDKPSAQIMVTIDDAVVTQNTLASIGGGAYFTVHVRALCTQMTNHMPDPSVKYHVAVQGDPTILALATKMSNERFRGPWDQARMWIHTNGASLEAINNVLLPGIQPGRYRELLCDVSQMGTNAGEHRQIDALLTPEETMAYGIAPEPIEWAVQVMSKGRGKELGEYAAKHGGELFAQDDKDRLKFSALLVQAMMSSSSDDVHKGAFAVLTKGLPAAKRDGFGEAGGFDGLTNWLLSKNPSDVKFGLDVIEQLQLKGFDDELAMAAVGAPSKELKTRAATLAKGS